MVQACIAALTICILAVMSIRANGRFKDEDRLPMQWSLDKSVNWTAPRPLALALTPVLAAIILSATVALTISVKPKAGQEGLKVPTISLHCASVHRSARAAPVAHHKLSSSKELESAFHPELTLRESGCCRFILCHRALVAILPSLRFYAQQKP